MKVATFNVNGLRARISIVLNWLEKHPSVILCLQETKVQDSEFPLDAFVDAGYEVLFTGKKGYEGVAIISQKKAIDVIYGLPGAQNEDERRLICAKFGKVVIVNTYVPQGRGLDSEMFPYKLQWYARTRKFFDDKFSSKDFVIWCGDLNVAPLDIDIYDPVKLREHVDVHPEVRSAYKNVYEWGFVDCFRMHHKEAQQYTYFDYRVRNALERKIGWRIDHILATKPLAARCIKSYIDLEPRIMQRPSDHTPLVAEFDI